MFPVSQHLLVFTIISVLSLTRAQTTTLGTTTVASSITSDGSFTTTTTATPQTSTNSATPQTSANPGTTSGASSIMSDGSFITTTTATPKTSANPGTTTVASSITSDGSFTTTTTTPQTSTNSATPQTSANPGTTSGASSITSDGSFITTTTATPKTSANPVITGSTNMRSTHVTTQMNLTAAFNLTTTMTTTSTTQVPFTYGSCAMAGMCCPGHNNSCHAKNCFCDVLCLRLHDCCPDFKPTCITVNNSTSTSTPSTLPLTGNCTAEPALCCPGNNVSCFRGCFCDEMCKQHNDCCPDFNGTCSTPQTSAHPEFNTTTNIGSSNFSENVIGLQVKLTSFLNLSQNENINLVLDQLKQELIKYGLPNSTELTLRKVQKTNP